MSNKFWQYTVSSTYDTRSVDFYYAADASNPDWIYIGAVGTIKSSNQNIMISYTIPSGATNQAVRVQLEYGAHIDYRGSYSIDYRDNPCVSGYNRESKICFVFSMRFATSHHPLIQMVLCFSFCLQEMTWYSQSLLHLPRKYSLL